ncbi:RNA polymerase sigma factor [Marinicellulosiphila megalodicopiae]|uniref:RNA polymerase sigma factor n=1 Tax=Marinicellulosiphila megalodicopiae TaxID=2724896 RepID=UPI003BAEA76F
MMSKKEKQIMGYLLGRCALKDQEAFEQLYSLCSANLYGLLFKMLKNNDDSNEVLQQVFEKIWRMAPGLTSEIEYPWAWLCQVTRNLAIDSIRAKARQKLEFQENVPEVKDTHNNFSYEPKLDECISTLNSQQKIAITKIYQFGYTQSELATHLDAPLGTVKSWIRRGLEALKICLS